MRHRFSMLAINLLFADAIISYFVKFTPTIQDLSAYILIALAILFSTFIIAPGLIKRFKKLIIGFPVLCLVLFPMLLFHIFYQAPVFGLENIEWLLLTIHPALVAIALLITLLNRWNFSRPKMIN